MSAVLSSSKQQPWQPGKGIAQDFAGRLIPHYRSDWLQGLNWGSRCGWGSGSNMQQAATRSRKQHAAASAASTGREHPYLIAILKRAGTVQPTVATLALLRHLQSVGAELCNNAACGHSAS
jgi:hypothetical protein